MVFVTKNKNVRLPGRPGFVGRGSDPLLSLFRSGDTGILLDRYGAGWTYQGTTTATVSDGAGETIGLWVDRSQRVALSGELLTNGALTAGSGWTATGNGALTADKGVFTAGVSGSTILQAGVISGNRLYQAEADFVVSAGVLNMFLGGNGVANRLPSVDGTGRVSQRGISNLGAAGDSFGVVTPGTSASGEVDNFSLREVLGNHPYQGASSGFRPTWQAGLVARFDGTDDYLATPWIAPAAGTIALRFTARSQGTTAFLAGAADAGPTNRIGLYRISGVGGVIGYAIGGGAANTGVSVANDETATIILTYGGGSWALYKNGTLGASGSYTGAPTTTQPLYIGARNLAGTADGFAPMDLRRFLAISRVLSAAEIATIARAWSPPLVVGSDPVLGGLTDGDQIGDAFTAGSYSGGTGTITVARQMRVDGGSWQTYSATQAVAEGEVWQVRETATDALGASVSRDTAEVTVAAGASGPPDFTVETGDDTLIGGASLTGSESLTLTIPSGTYAGTYTTDWEGTPLTASLLAVGEPILIVEPVVTEDPADTHTATPGLWLANADMEFTQRYTSGGVEVATGGTYVHSGSAQVEYRETASTGVGDPVEWSTIVEEVPLFTEQSVRFDGTNDYLNIATDLAADSATMLVCISATLQAADGVFIHGHDSNNFANVIRVTSGKLIANWRDTGNNTRMAVGSGDTTVSFAMGDRIDLLLAARMSSDGLLRRGAIRKNGGAWETFSTGLSNAGDFDFTFSNVRIGALRDGTGKLNANVHRIAMWTGLTLPDVHTQPVQDNFFSGAGLVNPVVSQAAYGDAASGLLRFDFNGAAAAYNAGTHDGALGAFTAVGTFT